MNPGIGNAQTNLVGAKPYKYGIQQSTICYIKM